MKKMFVGLLVGCFIVFSNFALAISEDAATESVFEMKDAYFQIEHRCPLHLTHGPVKKQYLRLEDKFRLWIFWEIEEGKESPCPRRGENFCSEKLEITGKDLDGKERVWNLWDWKDSKIDKDFSWSVPGYVPKNAAFGEAKIRVRITDKNEEKIYYSFEIPIEIR